MSQPMNKRGQPSDPQATSGSGQQPPRDIPPQTSEPGHTPLRGPILIGLAVLIFLLVFLPLLAPTPPTPRCFVIQAAEQSAGAQQAEPIQTAGDLSYFLDKQIILTGYGTALGTVTTTLEEQGIQLRPLQECDLGGFTPSPELPLESEGAAFGQVDTVKLQLFEISSTQPVTQVLAAVEAITSAETGRPKVFADPNYKTAGLAGAGPCGSPDHIGGSPDHIGGSPDHIGGSPGDTLSSMPLSEAQKLFREQWAYTHIGLGPLPVYTSGAAALSYAGQGIRVGVFDTSPFEARGLEAERIAPDGSWQESIDWISPTFTLAIQKDAYRPQAAIADPHSIVDPVALKQHGLFVAGLIHGLAPQSDIRLYPVLNDYGCGDLFSLIVALNEFSFQVDVDRAQHGLRGAVANLSLGLIKPASPQDLGDDEVVKLEDICGATISKETCRELIALLASDPVEALQMTVERAYDSGVVVVAAAGNGSGRDAWPVRPPDLPAAYPTVLGVSASNVDRQRACFSNWGDVAAPGGDGGPDPAQETSTGPTPSQTPVDAADSDQKNTQTGIYACGSSPGARYDNGDYANRVVSLVQNRVLLPLAESTSVNASCKQQPQNCVESQGYAYWKGTSFSAPLVSGLAALVLDSGARKVWWYTFNHWRWMSPDLVAEAIHCGAATADGVINVPATLVRCLRDR